MSSYFQGAVKSGDNPSEAATGTGTAIFSQTALISFDADLVQENIFVLPKDAQIVDIVADVLTAYNSSTSATLTVGSASAGTQYAGAVDAKTAGRVRPTFSAAQLAAMDDIDGNTSVYATITSSGQPTAGSTRVTVMYTGGSF
jgi:hypothetical protein